MVRTREAIRTEREDVVLHRNKDPEDWRASDVPKGWTNFDIIRGEVSVGTLAVFSPASSDLLGIAYEIEEEYRKDGLASLALRGMLEHARDVWQVPGFEITVDPNNLPSVKTALRGGLDFTGYNHEFNGLEFSVHF